MEVTSKKGKLIVNFGDKKLKEIAVIALVAIAISTGLIAL